jgi:hypothetical protein
MTRSPLDVPCPACNVSAGRYCDGAEPCLERVAKAGEADAEAARVRAIQAETVRKCSEWLRQRAAECYAAVNTYGNDESAHMFRGDALIGAADELSLEVLP